ncbi:hypothetical protein L1987_14526 [Smallanthus sonchifolius]|uniref:Uncharacterized protein n=1 Tax=Smallanthus sonchifolius TaxID=185202 RepID=A0ACB9J3W6_9ASTR|nr:hypothetical protein L1987_14526 [Smallanthus sonchifolius]
MTVVPDNGRRQEEREKILERERLRGRERTWRALSPSTTKDGCGGSRWQRRLGFRRWHVRRRHHIHTTEAFHGENSRWVVFHGAVGSVNPDLVSSNSDLFTSTLSGARSLVEG